MTLIAKQARGVSSFALAWWQCALGTLALLAWPVLHGWPAGLGEIHTGLAYVLLYVGMARLATGRIALLQFVYPAAAIAMDWAVYGRALSMVQLMGVALMAAALTAARPGVMRAFCARPKPATPAAEKQAIAHSTASRQSPCGRQTGH